MEYVFFFYGLAFFLMGFAVLSYPKKDSSFFLARKLHWVGWFGIVHGINEWLDLFIMIETMGFTDYLKIVRGIALPVSFICLIYFGTEVISGHNSKCRFCKVVTPAILVIWAAIFLLGERTGLRWDFLLDERTGLRWDIWSRYLLGFTGATLTGIAFWMHVPEIEVTENFKLAFNLKAAGTAFIAYGVLAGLIVPAGANFFPASQINYLLFIEKIGIPVQVFRTICAALTAYHLIRVLKIFQWETRQALYNSELRFKTVIDTAPVVLFVADSEQKITFMEGRGMESLGIESADALEKSLAEVLASMPHVPESAEKVLAGEEFSSTVLIGNSYLDVFLAPLRDRRGNIRGITGVAVDVTEQKTAQAWTEKYRYDMEKNKALAAIGTLSTEIARDMLKPLNESKVSLLKASSGLRKTIGAEEVKMNIRKGAEGVAKAINKLYNCCDKANLEKPLAPQPIDIDEVTRRILSVFQETIQRAMVRISLERANILPVMHISSHELEQIFYSLIQNVIKSADGIHLHQLDIDFSIRDGFFFMMFSEYCVDVSPADTGKTLAEKREALYSKDKYNFELSVLKGITEAYGGTITIKPNSRGGLLYEIQLPVAD